MATLNPADTLDDFGEKIADLDGALTAAVDTSNDFFNHGDQMLVVSNASAGNRVVTFTARADPYNVTGSALVITIPAGKIGVSGFMNPAIWNSGGKCTFTLDAVAPTQIGILKLRKIR